MQLADARRVALLHPSVAVGNNATSTCHTGDAMAGNCKEIARGCWDGYGQLGAGYALQDAPHMAAAWKMLAHLARLDSSHAS
ncbi:hypothetical protein M885DRAFT_510140 [Pelagophyceae sp. CCMP2097]|nr:hypothetical protein M885DRAFT_510140 [Pelagophyceae sp. CCMP2097]